MKRGNEHDYLGMVLRYEGKKVLIDMTKYVKEMHEEHGEHKYHISDITGICRGKLFVQH